MLETLIGLLRNHQPADALEADMTARTLTFMATHPHCLERSLLEGHITGSAWITSPDGAQALLIHHRKLDRWFQPGGHADGNPDVAAVALLEAEEETGLTTLTPLSPVLFDVDIHPIPARGEVPAHLHYDLRFRFTAHPDEPLPGENREVKGIRWLTLDQADQLADSESISRMIRKSRQ